MHTAVQQIVDELYKVEKAVRALSEKRKLSDAVVWHLPTLSSEQLADMVLILAAAIEEANVTDVDEQLASYLPSVASSIQALHPNIIPNLVTGNAVQAVDAYIGTISYCGLVLRSLTSWGPLDPNTLPNQLIRKLSKIDRDIATMAPTTEELKEKVDRIISAHDAAVELPGTLQELRIAQGELRISAASASEALGRISAIEADVVSRSNEIRATGAASDSILAQVEEAHQITTSIGLAAAFDDRARRLNGSVYLWFAGLVIALCVAMIIGYFRLSIMREVLAEQPFNPAKVWVQLILSALSIGAPIWLAWLSTKQVSQRFKLSEDYAYKATIAKAYEGFRRQAARVDPEFEKVLFASALVRLDEAPLRLMESAVYGSPLHEAAGHKSVKSALSGIRALVFGKKAINEPDESV